MQDLINEYKESLKKIRKVFRSLENKPSRTYDDLEDMRKHGKREELKRLLIFLPLWNVKFM